MRRCEWCTRPLSAKQQVACSDPCRARRWRWLNGYGSHGEPAERLPEGSVLLEGPMPREARANGGDGGLQVSYRKAARVLADRLGMDEYLVAEHLWHALPERQRARFLGGPVVKRVQLRRGKPLQRGRRRSYGRDERIASRFWHDTVTASSCVMPGPHDGPIEGHHVVPKQILKREGHAGALWDVRNGIPLCRRCHEKHEWRLAPVPRHLIPAAAFEFAAELGLSWVLERAYPDQLEPAP